MQPGDVPRTAADVADLVREVGYRPSTKVEEGIKKFVEWFVEYFSVIFQECNSFQFRYLNRNFSI